MAPSPSKILRRAAAVSSAGLLLALVLAAIHFGRTLPERWLHTRECSAARVGWSGLVLVLEELSCPGLRARRAEIRPVPWRKLHVLLEGAVVDADRGESAAAGSRPSRSFWRLEPEVRDLSVTWKGKTLLEGLEGSLDPLSLRGPGVLVTKTGDEGEVSLERPLDFGWARGTLLAHGRVDLATESLAGEFSSKDLSVRHPLLSASRWSVPEVRGEFEVSIRDRSAEGTVGCSGVEARWSFSPEPVFVLDLAPVSAARALAPFVALAPELERAVVTGTMGLHVKWSLTDSGSKWEVQPDIAGLSVDGALPPGVDLGAGPFTYRVVTAAGEVAPRRSGEGTPGWTPLSEVSPSLVQAIVAAEDIGFYRHHGWDPKALQEAIDADLAAGEVRRGGSTLTQQLAKNLFLDADQTLARKLREILLAVEMDRTLGKQRILELYVNIVEWGPDLWGIRAAADACLLKDPKRLNPLEGAFFAAMLPSPRRYYTSWVVGGRSPSRHTDPILDNMTLAGWLTPAEAAAWKGRSLHLLPAR